MSLLFALFLPSLASLAFMVVVTTMQTLHLRLPSRSTTVKARLLLFPPPWENLRAVKGRPDEHRRQKGPSAPHGGTPRKRLCAGVVLWSGSCLARVPGHSSYLDRHHIC